MSPCSCQGVLLKCRAEEWAGADPAGTQRRASSVWNLKEVAVLNRLSVHSCEFTHRSRQKSLTSVIAKAGVLISDALVVCVCFAPAALLVHFLCSCLLPQDSRMVNGPASITSEVKARSGVNPGLSDLRKGEAFRVVPRRLTG